MVILGVLLGLGAFGAYFLSEIYKTTSELKTRVLDLEIFRGKALELVEDLEAVSLKKEDLKAIYLKLEELETLSLKKDDKTYLELQRILSDAFKEGEGHFVVRKADRGEFYYLNSTSVINRGRN